MQQQCQKNRNSLVQLDLAQTDSKKKKSLKHYDFCWDRVRYSPNLNKRNVCRIIVRDDARIEDFKNWSSFLLLQAWK